MQEIWIPVKEFEDLYAVSNLGRVKAYEKTVRGRFYPETILSTHRNKTQEMINFKVNQKSFSRCVARLVAEAFLTPEEGKPFVMHLDCNTFNNKATNLKWAKMEEINLASGYKRKPTKEVIHKFKEGSIKKHSKKVKNVTTGKIYNNLADAAREYNITPQAIGYNCNGITSHCLNMQWRFILCEGEEE